MGLEMIDLQERDAERNSQPLCETAPYEEGPDKAGAAGVGHGREIGRRDAGYPESLADHGHYILLMGPGSKLGHNTSVGFMDLLRGDDIAAKDTVGDDGCRSIVARRFDSQYDISHFKGQIYKLFGKFLVILPKFLRKSVERRRLEDPKMDI